MKIEETQWNKNKLTSKHVFTTFLFRDDSCEGNGVLDLPSVYCNLKLLQQQLA
jgi:hypothetical protein